MKGLIEALQILLKYGNPKYPTHCSYDELRIVGIEPESISKEDVEKLEELGIFIALEGVYDEDDDYTPEESKIYSYRYGSA